MAVAPEAAPAAVTAAAAFTEAEVMADCLEKARKTFFIRAVRK